MCRFKSGIIFKNRVEIAQGENDSHSDLLESLGVEDNYLNASKVFVRAELVPINDEWWVSPEEYPDKWKFFVDQDIVPDWFEKGAYEKSFREAVCQWWKEHVLVDRKIELLSSGYYRLKRCEVKRLCNDVKVLLENSQVGEMRDNSQVVEMWYSSQVGEMWDNSQVGKMLDNSQVGKMLDNSQVGKMLGISQVGKMLDNSQVGKMLGISQVGEMLDNSQVGEMQGISRVGEMWDNSQVGEMRDNSQVGEMRDSSQVGEMRDSSQVGEMWGISQVGKMWDNSQVGGMWYSSQVGEMWDSSTARDFKNYPNITIWVYQNWRFKVEAHKGRK